MISYIIIFFILGVVSAYLGFGRLAGAFATISKILAFIFLAFFIIGLAQHLLS